MQGVNIKTNLALRKLAKKEAKKAATTARIIELVAVKKMNAITVKLRKAKVAEKFAIKKKALKAKVDMKKVNN